MSEDLLLLPVPQALPGSAASNSTNHAVRLSVGVPVTPETGLPRLNLALQGGGAHGAFTWGVLDALLEDGRVSLEGLSGSSAGAMNAVLLAQGWLQGGPGGERDAARQALADFWNDVAQPMAPGMVAPGLGDTFNLLPAGHWVAHWAGYFSPSQLNPLALNPLRKLLERLVDFERLRAHSPFKLFVGATQANTGRLRVFREYEMSLDVLMASACLPRLFDPVEIEGEPYWDGGYCANPPVSPLFYDCDTADVLMVLLNPMAHESTPRTVKEIEQRLEDLSFNSTFLREMQLLVRAGQFAQADLFPTGPFPATRAHANNFSRRLQEMRFHLINAGKLDSLQRSETKMLAHAPFLQLLFRQGREQAASWLAAHRSDIGQRSSIDMVRLFG